uniref:Uncharacterized protein n=1 Tax=Percolomonas cosmopolitus TaxID=63605 RepID=A0A7S1KTA4_9EUKA|mmetsp:Transcript_8667/g.32004  ORF Transcript_8667/g.32004 Transcript_8667/m.32004 type:complete len:441 (+) Transcript_8667:459-1781(+)|eukprot:CAMPEP_0117447550 /NCGR_PEP_ID=MMETSP0759-20121206/6935_1 /TAXON_ID=63605 /ORGANISM="Percolomonas cosmopolitus, Strain WS" /LENGTH=440 /DNA_ID=CAMNT_0005239893 /DNA_START=382 /DNA_END=1704 /DNA_ORIENTATION=-
MTRESLSALSKQDVVIPQGGHNYTKLQIREVQSAIEKGLTLYKSKMEIFAVLKNVDQNVVNLVWQKLEQNNPRFFTAYLIRLAVIKQIKVFQQLMAEQDGLMAKQGSGRMTSAANVPPSSQQNMKQQDMQQIVSGSSGSGGTMNVNPMGGGLGAYGHMNAPQNAGFPNPHLMGSFGGQSTGGPSNLMDSAGMPYGNKNTSGGSSGNDHLRSGSTPPLSGSSGMPLNMQTAGQFPPQLMQQLSPQMFQQLRQMQMGQFPMPNSQQQSGGGFPMTNSINSSPHMAGMPQQTQFQMQYGNNFSGFPNAVMGGNPAMSQMGQSGSSNNAGFPSGMTQKSMGGSGMMNSMGGMGSGSSPQQNNMFSSMGGLPSSSSGSSIPQMGQSNNSAPSGGIINGNKNTSSSDKSSITPSNNTTSSNNIILDTYDTADENEIESLLDDSIFD